ncbi:probable WRKY transcription factor 53 [Olea europaea subsp. europaea]|uniref:Probable WRKY transcription factor 53 n=1 Tax=Olea europaea subsp. europaea TaxID=158383 RepID=A0A8S0Q194_OLEEU|nr:probable WRKY transcription factor 53 [Olea europaea subsp. europaea]
MENSADLELKSLMNELTQGRELAEQLRISLNTLCSSDESCEFLIQRIKNSYEKALSMLNNDDDLDREFKEYQNTTRKRKAMTTSTKKVQLCPGIGLEEQLDDGYSWKKYGQKDILRAKYPRGYYRCSHGRGKGCIATKKVQRSNNDPTVVEITYIGEHTCNHVSSSNPTPTLPENDIFPDTNNQSFQAFNNLPPSSINPENYIFHNAMMDNDVLGTFTSPTTSVSTYFAISPTLTSDYGGNNAQASQSEAIAPFTSSATSSRINSPVVGLDFPFAPKEIDSNFPFGSLGFFP